MKTKLSKAPFIYFIISLVSVTGHAQDKIIPIEEITIQASRKSSFLQDISSLRIDSLQKGRYAVSDLATLLKAETNINITQYGGEGSLSSVRLRGTGPSHTQINWNGIPLNSPSTGSVDLSLMSSLLTDEIEVIYGASGSMFGSGTFGGSLNLINKPDFKNKLSVNSFTELGSWDHFKSGAGLRVGNGKWQYHAGGFFQSSPNTYTFENPYFQGNPVQTRLNDSLVSKGFQNYVFIKLKHNWNFQAGMWLQNRHKNLPAPMSATQYLPSSQIDQSSRVYGRLTKGWSGALMEINLARLSDSLTYQEFDWTGSTVTRSSGFNSTVNSAGITGKWYLGEHWTMDAGTDLEIMSAKGSSFTGQLHEIRSSGFGSVRYNKNNFNAIAGIRQVWVIDKVHRTLFNISSSYLSSLLNLTFNAQISNKFRLPTFNERYWQPGGNPGLLPETGIGYETGIEWAPEPSGNIKSSLAINAFIQDVDNWVQWVPAGTYWSPRNIKNVRCQGFDANAVLNYSHGSSKYSLKGFYSYTESLDLNLLSTENRIQKQLPYIPLNQLLAKGSYEHGQLGFNLTYRYTGIRFTTDDHDPWLVLPPVHLFDTGASYLFRYKDFQTLISFRINNILNYSYQLIRAYPAPGRSFLFSVNFMFNQKKAEYAEN